ncbi:MAG: phosphoserine phosphatase SerB, partial [Nitrospiria bacterium]
MRTDFVLTCLGPSLTPEVTHGITSCLADACIAEGERKTLSESDPECIEIKTSLESGIDPDELIQKLRQQATPFGADVVLQRDSSDRRDKKLLVMDMDSTLIQVEVIDELAKEAGIGDAVASITRRAMNGELNFNESLRERVGLLKGLPVSVLNTVYKRLPLTAGAQGLLSFLQKRGCKTGVLSGGFDYFTTRIKTALRMDYAHSNRLEVKDGVLTGKVVGEIVNGDKKVALLKEIADRESIPLNQTIAIGDGANDLPMIQRAGLGIAFNAKPAVRAAAPCSITQNSLLTVLYLLGFSRKDIDAFLQAQ